MSENIRNFCIIAHIDHGKSTLADRLLEKTGTIPQDKMHPQYLDMMDLEQERGITIKMQPVRMEFRMPNPKSDRDANSRSPNPEFFVLNLIDTPGHTDFSYEVSRSLGAVEGSILVVDATKGVQAQTVSNFLAAKRHKLAIIPAVNKIDLPQARIQETKSQIKELTGIPPGEILEISAKTGKGVEELLQRILRDIPAPKIERSKLSRALVFDSVYDPYQGVLAYVRVFEGEFSPKQEAKLIGTEAGFQIKEVGYFKPQRKKASALSAGEIGWIATGLKDIRKVRVGDTLMRWDKDLSKEKAAPFAGFRIPLPKVFASFYPLNQNQYLPLSKALAKLSLNDAALNIRPESNEGMGRGFRVGFLGLLHMEVTAQRLTRESGIDIIVASASVSYKVLKKNGQIITLTSPSQLPGEEEIQEIRQPWVEARILVPVKYLTQVSNLLKHSRAIIKKSGYFLESGGLEKKQMEIAAEMPLAEIMENFYDKLKAASSGFASFDYSFLGFRKSDLVKLDFWIAAEQFPAFSQIVPRDKAFSVGKALCKKLKETIPRENFAVVIQARIGSRVIARETIPALRKNVTAKLYGGDFSRKKKLLVKQRKGKARMRKFGRVHLPQSVFLKIALKK